jgi:hypothetical protein
MQRVRRNENLLSSVLAAKSDIALSEIQAESKASRIVVAVVSTLLLILPHRGRRNQNGCAGPRPS